MKLITSECNHYVTMNRDYVACVVCPITVESSKRNEILLPGDVLQSCSGVSCVELMLLKLHISQLLPARLVTRW